MRRTTLVLSLLLASSGVYAQQIAAENCEALPSLSVQSSALTPIAVELTAPLHRLGAPTGVLAQAYDELQSVDQVLSRQAIANCATVASVTPPPSPSAVLPAAVPDAAEVIDSAVYQPKTPYDNTPWRFDMSQNGKRMTADEFTAWMKARGVRVAKGASQPKAATTMTPAAARSPHARPDPTRDNMAGQGEAASIGQLGGMRTSLPLPPEPTSVKATPVHAAVPAPADMTPATSVAPLQTQPEPSQSAPVGQPPGTLPSTSTPPSGSPEKDEAPQPPSSP